LGAITWEDKVLSHAKPSFFLIVVGSTTIKLSILSVRITILLEISEITFDLEGKKP